MAKNDALTINFSLYIYFGNLSFLHFLDIHLDLLFKFRPFEYLYPESRALNFDSVTSLLYSELEIIIKYLPAERFSQLSEYLLARLVQEFEEHSQM